MHTGLPPPRIVIIMATYNGAAFLHEQLESIAAQTHAGWQLVWRDDGSTDGTVAVLRAFAAGQPGSRVTELPGPPGHLGASGGFLALLRHAVQDMAAHDLVAFADQDDVWLPDKLARAAAALGAGNTAEAALYSARQVLVDAALRPLAPSVRVTPPPGFPAALTQNLATGCTTVMNRAAARLVAGSTAPPGCQHDWWSYIVVTAAGGRFLPDDAEVVLYRQHGSNLVGAQRTVLRRAIAALRRGPGAFMRLLRGNVAALDAQRHLLSPQAAGELDIVKAALAGGVLCRLRALRRPGLRRQTFAEQVLFRLWFLLG